MKFRALILSAVCFLALSFMPAAAQTMDVGEFGDTCAPWDGPALYFKAHEAGTQYPAIIVNVYEKMDTEGKWDFPDAAEHRPQALASMRYCKGNEKCQIPVDGRAVVSGYPGDVTLDYTFRLDDGTYVSGFAHLQKEKRTKPLFCG